MHKAILMRDGNVKRVTNSERVKHIVTNQAVDLTGEEFAALKRMTAHAARKWKQEKLCSVSLGAMEEA